MWKSLSLVSVCVMHWHSVFILLVRKVELRNPCSMKLLHVVFVATLYLSLNLSTLEFEVIQNKPNMDLEKIVELGERLGYKDVSLQEFVKNESAAQERKNADAAERQERYEKRKREEEEKQWEHEEKMMEMKLELQKAQADNGEAPVSKVTVPKIKLPALQDSDNIDAYISRFERFAISSKWPKAEWATQLSALLKGKALQVYSRLSVEDCSDYDKLIGALQKRFQLTEEGYQVKFRTCRAEKSETPSQFAARLSEYFHRWVEMSHIHKTYECLVDLLLREQFLNCCSKDLKVYLREHKCSSIDHLAELAERYTEAHGLQSFTTPERTANMRHLRDVDKRRENPQSNQSTTKPATNSTSRRCYLCNSPSHLADKCALKGKTRNTKASSALHAPQSTENMSAPGTNDQSGKSTTLNYYNSKKNMPVSEGYINGKKVTALRDSGCDSIIVRSDLVKKEQITGRNRDCTLIDGTKRTWPIARVHITCPYFKGETEVMCVDTPVYDIVVGNVAGVQDDFINGLSTGSDHGRHQVQDCSKGSNARLELTEQDGVHAEVNAVETRSMKTKKEKPAHPLKVAMPIKEVNPAELSKKQKEDESIAHLWKISDDPSKNQGKYRFIVKDQWLLREYSGETPRIGRTQLVLPKEYRQRVMKIAHDSIMSGHQGINKTIEKIQSNFFWPKMAEDVRNFCRSCDICQRTIQKGKVVKAPLGRMPLIDVPFQRVAMDLIGPIHPVSDRGHRYILTIVDYATRYPEAVPLANIDTQTVAEALIDVYSRVGVPKEILTDMGTQFTSDLMKEVGRLLSIKQLTTTPYHPICTGLVERFNGTLKIMLKRMCT